MGGAGTAQVLRSALSVLLALAILAIALPVAFGGGARGAGVDSVRVFSSGSLVAPDAAGGASLSVGGLVPGETRTAMIRVGNPGSAATFGLSARVSDRPSAAGVALSSVLTLRIEAASGRTLFNGTLGELHRLGLGRFAAGARHAYRFTVSMPRSAGNAVAGATMSAAFAWTAS
jgi:spore coat-associated protein N